MDLEHPNVQNEKKKRSGMAGAVSRLAGMLSGVRNAIRRTFDESVLLLQCARVRRWFFRLRLRTVGVFLLTFGAYASVAASLVRYLSEDRIAYGDLYVGAVLMILSVPLLLSPDNISRALLASRAGNTLCDYLCVRRETLREPVYTGRANAAFILGVLAGMLTLWISPASILGGILAAVGICVILAIPENGILISALLLLLAGRQAQWWVPSLTIVAYMLKLLRGKRSLHLAKRDIFAVLVLISVLGGGLFGRGAGVYPGVAAYVLYICVYLLAAVALHDFRRIYRVTSALSVCGGVLAALYLAGIAFARYLPGWVQDSSFLYRTVTALPAFREGSAPILFMVLIPITVGGCLRSDSYISGGTAFLGAVSMAIALMICGQGAELLCAAAAVILLLLIYQKRFGFVILAVCAAAFVLFLYFGGSAGSLLYERITGQAALLYQGVRGAFADMMHLELSAFLFGDGFTHTFAVAGSLSADCSFYPELVAALGISGLLVFAVFVIVLATTHAQLLRRTFVGWKRMDELSRFGVVRSAADIRLGAAAPLCAIAAMLLSGSFLSFWQNETSFALFWLLCGISAAYVKSASREIDKANLAVSAAFGARNAALSLRRKRDDESSDLNGDFYGGNTQTETEYR